MPILTTPHCFIIIINNYGWQSHQTRHRRGQWVHLWIRPSEFKMVAFLIFYWFCNLIYFFILTKNAGRIVYVYQQFLMHSHQKFDLSPYRWCAISLEGGWGGGYVIKPEGYVTINLLGGGGLNDNCCLMNMKAEQSTWESRNKIQNNNQDLLGGNKDVFYTE